MTKEKRLKLAKLAKKAAAERRAAQEAEEKANLAHWLEGTAWPSFQEQLKANSTERSRAWRAHGREIGTIPPRRHPRIVESCRYNLLRFGLLFESRPYEGMKALLKRPPSPRMQRFVAALQDKILHGGLKHVRWPRGKGKSTWVKIAIIWAALYGHKFFMVVVEKTKGMAKVVVEEIWKRIATSPFIAADFPEFAIPLRDVALAPQRARVQTYMGRPTYIRMDVSQFYYYKLPTMEGMPHTGAIIAYRGADQALRGINIESARPDFFFLDDPQTDEDAKNMDTVSSIEDQITGAVLGSGETDERISAVMASTPIEPDDVSERFADPKRHPEWETETETFITTWGNSRLRDVYIAKLAAADACPPTDKEHKAHLQRDAELFYVFLQDEIEEGVEMMDDGDFDPEIEVSAYQHALWLLYTLKPKRFSSEYQMQPTRSQGLYRISPQIVASRVNGYEMGVIPPECDQGVLAFIDVNADAGLRWQIGAFGKGRILASPIYGWYPAEGQRLYPEGIPASQIPKYLAPALRTLVATILSTRLADPDGKVEPCSGVCIDGGWQTETVASIVAEFANRGDPVVWSRGYSAQRYSRYHHEKAAKTPGLAAGEECHLWETLNGIYLAINADHWKEVAQTSFFPEPLQPGSSSFYGSSEYQHFRFAQEVCAEELVAKDDSTKYGTVWVWKKAANRPNHFLDTCAGLLAYGSIRRVYDSISSVVSGDLLKRLQSRREVKYVVKGL